MKPIVATITDTHLKEDNIDLVKSIFDQAIQYCKNKKINTLIHGGDIFTSRKGQPYEVMEAWQDILTNIHSGGLHFKVIPGNHDRKNTNEPKSYLDFFDNNVYENFGVFHRDENVTILGVPFYDNEKYLENLKDAKACISRDTYNILITHIGINGALKNDKSEVHKGINPSDFKEFDKVLCGHFHDANFLEHNIYYIGSSHQANFGEDDNKGLTVIYENGSHEQIKLDFPEYITYNYNSKDLTNDEVKKIIKSLDSKNYYRVKISGSVNQVSQSVRKKLEAEGIKIDASGDDQILDNEELEVGKSFSDEDILESFNEWSEEREIQDLDYGKQKLEKYLTYEKI